MRSFGRRPAVEAGLFGVMELTRAKGGERVVSEGGGAVSVGRVVGGGDDDDAFSAVVVVVVGFKVVVVGEDDAPFLASSSLILAKCSCIFFSIISISWA